MVAAKRDEEVAVAYGRQLLPGTFEHALSYLIDNEIDLQRFAARFNNDQTDAPAYDPAVLLKIVLFAYSRGITSSRTMARACTENVVFIALACDQQPHFNDPGALRGHAGQGRGGGVSGGTAGVRRASTRVLRAGPMPRTTGRLADYGRS